MQIQKINFTRENNNQKQSAFYNRKNYLQMGAISDFMTGTALAFGILECRDKFSLIKKNDCTPAFILKQFAKKHTKRNIGLALILGTLYSAIDTALTKKFLPKIEKAYDKLDAVKNQHEKI